MTLLFWFTLTALSVLFSVTTGSCVQQKCFKNSSYTTCSPNNRQTKLVTNLLAVGANGAESDWTHEYMNAMLFHICWMCKKVNVCQQVHHISLKGHVSVMFPACFCCPPPLTKASVIADLMNWYTAISQQRVCYFFSILICMSEQNKHSKSSQCENHNNYRQQLCLYHTASWGPDRVFFHGRWEVISVGLHEMLSKWNRAIIRSDIRACCIWSRLITEWTHWLSRAGRRCLCCQEVAQSTSVFCKLIVDASDMSYT